MRVIAYLLFAFFSIFFLDFAFRRISWAFWDLMGPLYTLSHSLENHRDFGYPRERFATPFMNTGSCTEVWSECVNIRPGFYRPDSVEYRSWTYGCDAMRSLCSASRSSAAGGYE